MRTTINVHRAAGGCTLTLTDEQAQQVGDLLIPDEGSMADELGTALELLHRLATDYCTHGHQDGICPSQEANEFLIRHGLRTEDT